jgi:hypothetical protein
LKRLLIALLGDAETQCRNSFIRSRLSASHFESFRGEPQFTKMHLGDALSSGPAICNIQPDAKGIPHLSSRNRKDPHPSPT